MKKVQVNLIVAANPKAYSTEGGMWADELAGSVTAHYLHLWKQQEEKSKKLGVFFTCGFGKNGIAKFLYNFTKEEEEGLMTNFGKSINNIQISEYGYFYEPRQKQIVWRFKAIGLKTYNEIEQEHLKEYLPYFQLYGIEKRKEEGRLDKNERKWLLITKLKRLKDHISKSRGDIFQEFKLHTKNKKPLRGNLDCIN